MTGGQQPRKPYVRPSNAGESKRLTDIGGRSGHHAVIIGNARGVGYLGDMQGFALPFALTVIAVIVSVFRIWLGPDFPFALSMIGGASALLAIGFGVFLSVVITRNAAVVDYIDQAKVKRASIYLHISELVLLIVWLNWLTAAIAVSGAISAPLILAAATANMLFRIRRARLTRRRQLWER